jgi:hypothetical protein
MATLALPAIFSAVGSAGAASAAVGGPAFVAAVTSGSAAATSGFMGIASTMLGAYIDQTILMPSLFGDSSTGGTGTTEVQAVDEGAPFRYAIGPEARVPGFLAWQPRQLRYVPGQEGGKGSSSSKAPSAPKYYTDGLWLLTRVPHTLFDPELNPTGGGIPTSKRIWMDSKVRYLFDAASIDISSNNYRVTFRKEYGSGNIGSRRLENVIVTLTAQDPSDPSFDSLVTGQKIVVKGFDATPGFVGDAFINNQVTFPVGGQSPMNSNWIPVTGAPGSTEDDFPPTPYEIRGIGSTGEGLAVLEYAVPGAWFSEPTASQGAGSSNYVKYWGRIVSNSGVSAYYLRYGEVLESDEAYLGLDVLQAIEAPSNASGENCSITQDQKASEDGLLSSAFRGVTGPTTGTPYPPMAAVETDVTNFPLWSQVGIDNLFLQDFGTRLPNVEVLVKSDPDPVPLQEAIDRILFHYCEMPRDLFDVSLVDNTKTITGYWWAAPYQGREVLSPLMIAYDLVMFERNEKLIVASRSELEEITIQEEDLGVRSDGRSVDIPTISVQDQAASKVVKSVNVQYVDPNSGYQQASMVFTRPDVPLGDTSTIQLGNLTLEPDEARQIALRVLWQSSMFRRDVEFVVGPKYIGLTAGTYVNITTMGRSWRIMVTDVTRGLDGRMRCSGYEDDGVVEELPVIASDLGGGSGSINSLGGFYTPPLLSSLFTSLPAFTSRISATDPQLQVAISTQSPYAEWRSATADISPDPAVNNGSYFWASLLNTNQEALFGTITAGTLPDSEPDTINYIPPTSAFYVTLGSGELESVDLESVLSGQNQFLINGEILAISDCQLDSTLGLADTYKCFGYLLRGLHGTEQNIQQHNEGSQVVGLRDTDFFNVVDMQTSDIGVTKAYRAAAYAQDADTADPQLLALEPENVRPFTPAHLTGTPVAPSSLPPFYDTSGSTTYAVDDLASYSAPTPGTNIVAYRCVQAHPGSAIGAPVSGGGILNSAFWELLPYSDIQVEWNRRSRTPIQVIPDSTVGDVESLVQYEIDFFQGTTSTVVRTVSGHTAESYLYSSSMREQDNNLGAFNVRVRQIGQYLPSRYAEATLGS